MILSLSVPMYFPCFIIIPRTKAHDFQTGRVGLFFFCLVFLIILLISFISPTYSFVGNSGLRQMSNSTEAATATLPSPTSVCRVLVLQFCDAGVGMAQSLERRACHRKIAGATPGRSGGFFSVFFSQELTVCADSYSVSVPSPCCHSGTSKTQVILQPTHAYILDPTKSEWVDYAVKA